MVLVLHLFLNNLWQKLLQLGITKLPATEIVQKNGNCLMIWRMCYSLWQEKQSSALKLLCIQNKQFFLFWKSSSIYIIITLLFFVFKVNYSIFDRHMCFYAHCILMFDYFLIFIFCELYYTSVILLILMFNFFVNVSFLFKFLTISSKHNNILELRVFFLMYNFNLYPHIFDQM